MDTEKLTEHLIGGIALLKEIRQRNEEENKQIDEYLAKLLKDLQEEEEKEEQDDKGEPEEKPDTGKSKAEQKKEEKAKEEEAKKQKAKEADMEKAFAELQKMLKSKVEEEKLQALKEEAGKMASAPVEVDEIEEDGSGAGDPSTAEAITSPKKVVKTKEAEIKPTDELAPSGTATVVPEVEDKTETSPEGQWCAVCEEYHKEGDEVTI